MFCFVVNFAVFVGGGVFLVVFLFSPSKNSPLRGASESFGTCGGNLQNRSPCTQAR